MDYNERARLVAEANDPAYLPFDVLTAMNDQNSFCGDPVNDYGEGDRVWLKRDLGRGSYATVLSPIMGRPMAVVMTEDSSAILTAHFKSLTLLRRA